MRYWRFKRRRQWNDEEYFSFLFLHRIVAIDFLCRLELSAFPIVDVSFMTYCQPQGFELYSLINRFSENQIFIILWSHIINSLRYVYGASGNEIYSNLTWNSHFEESNVVTWFTEVPDDDAANEFFSRKVELWASLKSCFFAHLLTDLVTLPERRSGSHVPLHAQYKLSLWSHLANIVKTWGDIIELPCTN